jgi:hypothetical protein
MACQGKGPIATTPNRLNDQRQAQSSAPAATDNSTVA